MATNTHLPTIHRLQISKGKSSVMNETDEQVSGKGRGKAADFLSRLQLGSLEKSPRPGDVYYGSHFSKQPRPLGLIPNREDRLAALKKLNQLLSPQFMGHSPFRNSMIPQPEQQQQQQQEQQQQQPKNFISALVQHVKRSTGTSDVDGECNYPSPRTPGKSEDIDPDYMEAMDSKVHEFLASRGRALDPGHQLNPVISMPREELPTIAGEDSQRKKRKLERNVHRAITRPQYVNFTGQMQLFQRNFSDDKREAAEHELCERCRLRGSRCPHCKALRTGGGYIILDDGEDLNSLGKKRLGNRYGWIPALRSSGSEGKRMMRGKRRMDEQWSVEGGEKRWNEEGDGGGGSSGLARTDASAGGGGGVGSRGEIGGERGGWTGGSGDGGVRDGSGWPASGEDSHGRKVIQRTKESDGKEGGGVLTDTGHAIKGRDSRTGDADTSGGGGDLGDQSRAWETSERQSQASRSGSRMAKSRPGSTIGSRPSSSLRQSGKGLERRKKTRNELEKQSRQGRMKHSAEEVESGDDESEDDGQHSTKRRKRVKKDGEADTNDKGLDHQGSKFKRGPRDNNDEVEDEGQNFRGDLMKFKRKKDDVKALHATLKELQGIDPLDYLAKYCIIDQTKLPHYQHVFDNVDRDEDDEIDIGELDFALKAVNYNLITDAEMNYVNSVLELAGRYKLNFRLFSLIAALSEKVVALEDMVKRLINKMDFDALEIKMKKCKELFYLLADSDAVEEHEGGVVTTNSLAVELQAGGLTQEHVEFVVDRLNHEDRGLVEFLDYLTYVPLFVEIHDSIYGNPLDFTRTK